MVHPVKSELWLRIVSAIVLIAVALILTVSGKWSFALLVCTGVVIMCWEWGRITRKSGVDAVYFVHAVSAVLAVLAVLTGYGWAGLPVLLAGSVAAMFLAEAPEHRKWNLMAPFYTGLPAMALVWLRAGPNYGLSAVVFLFFVVWVTDSAAFFAGRAIGGPKLAPSISPKKTWAGFLGGTLGAAVTGLLFAWWLGNTSLLLLALVAFVLAAFSQVGDLFESALKRTFDVKDSSQIIPGHGGVLDRVDGLLFAALLGAVIAYIHMSNGPGAALLVW